MSTEKQNLDEIAGLVARDPYLALDRLIAMPTELRKSTAFNRRTRNLTLCCILEIAGNQVTENDDVERIALETLRPGQSIANRQDVVACLLRMLPHKAMDWLKEIDWRRIILERIQDCFGNELYSVLKIDEKSLGHEKLYKLSDAVSEHEKRLERALQNLTSLERTREQRESLMKTINHKFGKVIFSPFFPDHFEPRLTEAYKRVIDYDEQRNSLEVVDAYKDAIAELLRLGEVLSDRDTHYSQLVRSYVVNKLVELLKDDFNKNEAVQPAQVILIDGDKKYPLHFNGASIRLLLIVQNQGPGFAYDTNIKLETNGIISIETDSIELGRLAPEFRQVVEVPATISKTNRSAEILVSLYWKDYDGSSQNLITLVELRAQKENVDWDNLRQSDPYSLEPVFTEAELIGRRELLGKLINTLVAGHTGSAIIRGQKRVGKTSIARALESHLRKANHIVVYLEGGDYVQPDAAATISRLGDRLCKEIRLQENRIGNIEVPNFKDGLAPLAEYLDDVTRIASDRRIIFILDEFDELPIDLYERGQIGNAFFLNLRSISSKPTIGVVLVGGEKMNHVLDCQGERLNKWEVLRVDYFSKESNWSDYRELVQRPVANALEYSESALHTLHDTTAGNPYFTKLICQRVLQDAISRYDCHITQDEINKAIRKTVIEIERNTFQHFWEDGIFDTGQRASEKSVRRRRILIAVSDTLSVESPATKQLIMRSSLIKSIGATESELEEFVTRNILVPHDQDRAVAFKVPLFQYWLRDRGVQEIMVTFADLDAELGERQLEEKQRVQPKEIIELVKTWGVYRGQRISEDSVRAWLAQFGGIKEQRLAFSILGGVRFFTDEFLRAKMYEAHKLVNRRIGETGTLQTREGRKRSDVLVSYLDSPGKSGAHFARLYADEARIYVDNVIEKGRLVEEIRERLDIRAIVFVDDFVGTGKSASNNLIELANQLGELSREKNIVAFFVAVVAFTRGWSYLENIVDKLDMSINIHACEDLDESSIIFGEHSGVFDDSVARDQAKTLAEKFGKLIVSHSPLGFGDNQLAVVFEHSCPNNSLPILWAESHTVPWIPLFKRL